MDDFQKRIDCWKDTIKLCNNLQLISQPSIKHRYQEQEIPQKRYLSTEISVENNDSIYIGLELKTHGNDPLVLNFADDAFPGGHVAVGSGAQEESLFRRTNYHQTLNHDTGFYPLNDTDVVYSPGVIVLKDLAFEKYPYPQTLSFIACPGLRHPSLLQGNTLRVEDMELLTRKIETIFQVGYLYKHDCLVLGALGCGAWNNPPTEVATIFKYVCQKWDGVFKKVVFACFEINTRDYIVKPKNAHISNYNVFKDVLVVNDV